jgi:hypothetical protein
MEQKNREKSRVRDIAAEIAHDLGINKALVKEVLLLTFKEIAVTLCKIRYCIVSNKKD